MTVEEAKNVLPLPALLHREGLGDHAKKKALCPFHDDQRNSFSVYRNDAGAFRWKCFTGCGSGDEVAFLEKRKGISRSDAAKLFIGMAGANASKPPGTAFKKAKAVMSKDWRPEPKPVTLVSQAFDWQKCVDAFSAKHLERLSEWRGFPGEFCSELKASGLVGIFEDYIALPVHDRAGKVIAAHVRAQNGKWFYEPTGTKTRALVIGELVAGDPVHVFESQWDAFAFMAVSGERSGIVITRGASNGALVAGVIPQAATVYLWPQNDAPGLKWAKDVCSHATCAVKSAKTPAQFADLNDWTKDGGATAKDLLGAIVNAGVLREPEVTVTSSQSEEASNSVDVDALSSQENAVELPRAPASYVPPPLDLLPGVLQDYVHAAAESLNVDIAYPFLPLLSSLGSALGNARSIILKRGFVQPPVIWTGLIGPTGSLKSPGLETGWLPVLEHERELKRLNQQAVELFEEDLARWKSENSKKRGPEPEKPVILTCLMDDLTIEALSDRLATNSRGVLVAKDEISHWFASFDQYKNAKGSDVSRWLSLHTAVFLAVDRMKDNRHHRIWMPRVCITGGIQPKILRRVLTEEFFERGLPARFLFAYPKTTQPRWSEETISDELQNKVLKLFANLWLLQPERDEHDQARPKLLRLDDEAKQIFVHFYNECGAASVEADEQGAAAWCKLSGYAARLALVGQLARDPNAEIIPGDTMKAACDLAGWFGSEGVRIYASLSETQEQRERRELIEFVERRGGKVTVREVTQLFRPLKNNRDEAERQLNALVRAKHGEWTETKGARGPATREFHLLRVSTSTGFEDSPSVTPKPVDVDSLNSQKNEASRRVSEKSEAASPLVL